MFLCGENEAEKGKYIFLNIVFRMKNYYYFYMQRINL